MCSKLTVKTPERRQNFGNVILSFVTFYIRSMKSKSTDFWPMLPFYTPENIRMFCGAIK